MKYAYEFIAEFEIIGHSSKPGSPKNFLIPAQYFPNKRGVFAMPDPNTPMKGWAHSADKVQTVPRAYRNPWKAPVTTVLNSEVWGIAMSHNENEASDNLTS